MVAEDHGSCQRFAIAWVEAEEIDQLGMSRAGKLVFEQAIAGLKSQPGYLLLDYFKLPQVSTPPNLPGQR